MIPRRNSNRGEKSYFLRERPSSVRGTAWHHKLEVETHEGPNFHRAAPCCSAMRCLRSRHDRAPGGRPW